LFYFLALQLLLLRKALFRPGIIVFEDMVPFFTRRQLFDYLFDSWFPTLQNYPLRGRYIGIWATALRHVSATRLSMVLLLTLAGFAIYTATLKLVEAIAPAQCSRWRAGSALVSATYVLLILSAAKLSHYYSLILGSALSYLCIVNFMLFAFGSSQGNRGVYRTPLVCAALMCFIPSIQVLVLLYAALGLTAVISALSERNTRPLTGLGIISLLHLAPYAIFLQAITGSEPTALASDAAPLSYAYVSGWSVSSIALASGAQFSALSMYTHGNYMPVVSLPALFQAPLFLACMLRRGYRRSRPFVGVSILYMVSCVMAFGVSNPLGGYHLWLRIVNAGAPVISAVADAGLRILRAPHRWMLLQVFFSGVFVALLLTAAMSVIQRWNHRIRGAAWAGFALLTVGAMAPFVLPPYEPIVTGDLGGALRPVVLPDIVQTMRRAVVEDPDDGLLIAYPIQGMDLVQWDDATRSLVGGEFYCFLFESACVEGAAGTSPVNQLAVTTGYHLLRQGSPLASSFYAALGVRHLFLHFDQVSGQKDASIQPAVLRTLQTDDGFRLAHENAPYWLFEVSDDAFRSGYRPVLLATYAHPDQVLSLLGDDTLAREVAVVDVMNGDIGWEELKRAALENPRQVALYKPSDFSESDVLRSLLHADGVGVWSAPARDCTLAAGCPSGWRSVDSQIASTGYFETISSHAVWGGFSALSGAPLLTQSSTSAVDVAFSVPSADVYDVAIRLQCHTGCELSVGLDSQPATHRQVSLDGGRGYRFVPVYTGLLLAGEHRLTITPQGAAPIAIDIVYAVPGQVIRDGLAVLTTLLENGVIGSLTETGARSWGTFDVAPFYFYNQDLYSRNLRFASPSERDLTPVRSWFGASVALVDRETAAQATPPRAYHVPRRPIVAGLTGAYLAYCIGLAVASLVFGLRAWRRHQLPAALTPAGGGE